MNYIKMSMNSRNIVPIDSNYRAAVVTQLLSRYNSVFSGICRMLRCMALTTASGPPKSSFLRSCLIALNKGLNLENRVIGEQLKYPSWRDSCVSDEEWWRALSI